MSQMIYAKRKTVLPQQPTSFIHIAVITVLGMMLVACGGETADQQSSSGDSVLPDQNSGEDILMHPFDVNLYGINQQVCNPLSSGAPSSDPNKGIKAELFYADADLNSAQDYVDLGKKSDSFLFFGGLNVPTRLFSTGFPTETGTILKRDSGEDLFEYFGLRFRSVLKLPPQYPAGDYELALLSDDGSVLKLRDQSGQYVNWVNNDGDHSTRLGCATETLALDANSEIPMELLYYQGPRYHIALIPMWRLKSGSPEPRCGQSGNSLFFNFNNQEPKTAYLDLLNRGWEPIPNEAYSLPAQAQYNPCVTADSPKITGLSAELDPDGLIIVSWQTDMPATRQLLIRNLTTGDEILTRTDNVLRTQHTVSYSNRVSGETLEIRAVSVAANLGKAISAPITVVTP